jgi:cytochrome c oxidase cbb3-type subunit 3
MKKILAVCIPATLIATLAACQREQRDLRLDPPVAAALEHAASMPNGISGAPPEVYFKLNEPYAGNAWQLNQGKRLYAQFNCKGCHGDGGGASGPALIDGWWAWGSEIQSIYTSIRDGRPNGMPPFRDRLTTEQIWQLAGYVQKIGAYTPKAAAPGRNDEMQSRPAENRTPAADEPLRQPGRR